MHFNILTSEIFFEYLHIPLTLSDSLPESDTKASSPASFDLSDPEEFHKKLIDILNEPTETSKEQLKKLMAEMDAKSKCRCCKETKQVLE